MRVDEIIDSSLIIEENDKIILGFNNIITNYEKGAISRFIACICLRNTNCNNNTIASYQFANFKKTILTSK